MDSLRSSVVQTLRSGAASSMKPFRFGTCKIQYSEFSKLSTFIEYFGNPSIVKGKSAAYKPGKNELVFGFKKAVTIPNKALVIHEATHAVMDMMKIKMKIKYAEMFAYITQCQFAMTASPGSDRLWSDNPQQDNVFSLAWNLARKIQKTYTIDDEEYENLADSVLKVPKYADDCGVDAKYNGLF